METKKLIPALKDYIWGGTLLKKYRTTTLDKIGESWELSFLDAGPTQIEVDNKLVNLKDYVKEKDLGDSIKKFDFFPVLIKLINSQSNLSIQVHPNDEYALKNENSLGKTEMWYILDAEENAGIYVGFKNNENEESLLKAINNDTILDILNFKKVEKGECYFIPSGTIHAIGKGITLIEIQQNSNLTYRLYDYHRKDKDGNERELHVEKALKVIDYNQYKNKQFKGNVIGECKYFTSKHYLINKKKTHQYKNSFVEITFLEGKGTINNLEFKKFDSFFVPANKRIVIKGKAEYILTYVK